MSGCAFCQILAGDELASIVDGDDRVVAFMDNAPVTPGHLLVVPRIHATGLAELDAEDGAALFRMGKGLAAALYHSDIPCDGVDFFLADGAAAGQEVFHVHLHVIARTPGDGFGLRVDYRPVTREILDTQAGAIRAVLR